MNIHCGGGQEQERQSVREEGRDRCAFQRHISTCDAPLSHAASTRQAEERLMPPELRPARNEYHFIYRSYRPYRAKLPIIANEAHLTTRAVDVC